MLRSVLASEGLVGLYAGVSAPLLAVVPAYAVTFWSFDVASKAIRSMNGVDRAGSDRLQNQPLSIGQTAAAGGFSGMPVALFLGPLEKVKCEFQINPTKYRSLGDCLRQSSQRGVSHVMRGTGLTMMRDVPGNAAFFATYIGMRQILSDMEGNNSNKPSMGATLVAGGLAGMANWVVAIPMDTIKSRWQVAPPGTYKSPVEVLSRLVEREGPRALFRGLAPALVRAVPANAAGLLGVETARSLLRLDA